MEQRIRQKGRLSARARNIMTSIGGGMLFIVLYLCQLGGYQFIALFISTIIGTLVGYFLVRDNAVAVIVSAGCASILLILAQFLKGATMEEFLMWGALAIPVFFIYSLGTTLIVFPTVDKYIASRKSGAFELESESISTEQDSEEREGAKEHCPKCDSLNIRSNRPWWGFLIMGDLMFFLKKYNCSDCGYSFSHGASVPKIDSTKSPSKEEIIEKWKGTPGMDHIRKK